MRKLCLILALGVLLAGCGTVETYETIADEAVVSVLAEPKAVKVDIPDDSVLPAMETDSGTLYMCNGYDITVQTLESGDLDGTIQQVSGYSRDDLTVMETVSGENRRYEFVWTATGEDGEQVCRAAVLDDGSYHYVLTAQTPAEAYKEYQEIWNGIFESFALD